MPRYEQYYKNGSKVKIRNDLSLNKKYPGKNGSRHPGINEDMLTLSGETFTIKGMDSSGYYRLHGSDWAWTDSMFEGYNKFNSLLDD